MNDFIYSHQSLSNEICDEIIELYNKEGNNINPGVVASGLNKLIKDTSDFVIPIDIDKESCWYKINNILSDEMKINLDIYSSEIKKKYDVELLTSNYVFESAFMIQKYEKNKGKYIYHDDFSINLNLKKYRVITFIWYLNDVIEGGETEFFGTYKITPKKGKLLFFPAGWLYPHCGKTPISSDKYIITGWLYVSI